MESNKHLEFTGERLVTGIKGDIVELHLHRYALALEFVRSKNVLDIASGEGYGSNLLSNIALSVIGVDVDEQAVKFSKSKYNNSNLKFIVGKAENIPLENNSVDVIVSFETIEHHDKHIEMFLEFKRVLKSDGLLILSSPDKLNYTDIPKYKNQFHIKELYREDFKALVKDYFSEVITLYQTMAYVSIIVTEDGIGSGFKEYSGDFESIESSSSINYPVYNICIASDHKIKQSDFARSTVFNCDNLLTQIKLKESEIYNSKTYKLGNYIILPFRFIKKILFRK